MNDQLEASWAASKDVVWYKWTVKLSENREFVAYSRSPDAPPLMDLASKCERIEPPTNPPT